MNPSRLPIAALAAAALLAACDNPGSPEIDRDACARAGLQAAYAGNYGSSGFAYLAGRGGVYHLTAGVDGVRWMIVRIR